MASSAGAVIGFGFVVPNEVFGDEDPFDVVAKALGCTDDASAWTYLTKVKGLDLVFSGAHDDVEWALIVEESAIRGDWCRFTPVGRLDGDEAHWHSMLGEALTALGLQDIHVQWLLGVNYG